MRLLSCLYLKKALENFCTVQNFPSITSRNPSPSTNPSFPTFAFRQVLLVVISRCNIAPYSQTGFESRDSQNKGAAFCQISAKRSPIMTNRIQDWVDPWVSPKVVFLNPDNNSLKTLISHDFRSGWMLLTRYGIPPQ